MICSRVKHSRLQYTVIFSRVIHSLSQDTVIYSRVIHRDLLPCNTLSLTRHRDLLPCNTLSLTRHRNLLPCNTLSFTRHHDLLPSISGTNRTRPSTLRDQRTRALPFCIKPFGAKYWQTTGGHFVRLCTHARMRVSEFLLLNVHGGEKAY